MFEDRLERTVAGQGEYPAEQRNPQPAAGKYCRCQHADHRDEDWRAQPGDRPEDRDAGRRLMTVEPLEETYIDLREGVVMDDVFRDSCNPPQAGNAGEQADCQVQAEIFASGQTAAETRPCPWKSPRMS